MLGASQDLERLVRSNRAIEERNLASIIATSRTVQLSHETLARSYELLRQTVRAHQQRYYFLPE